jgi:hypothetical protein
MNRPDRHGSRGHGVHDYSAGAALSIVSRWLLSVGWESQPRGVGSHGVGHSGVSRRRHLAGSHHAFEDHQSRADEREAILTAESSFGSLSHDHEQPRKL